MIIQSIKDRFVQYNKYLTNKPYLRLSLDFSKKLYKDPANRGIFVAKFFLDGLQLWPTIDTKVRIFWNIFYPLNLILMLLSTTAFLFTRVDSISVFANTLSTVSSTIQASGKFLTMRFKSAKFNHLLQSVANDFWPSEISTEKTRKSINNDIRFIKWFTLSYLFFAYSTCTLFVSLPFFYGNMAHPIPSLFPFKHERLFLYEMCCLWEWFCNSCVIYTITGFDFLMLILMNCCVSQFKILQDVLRNVCHGDPVTRERIFRVLEVREEDGKTKEAVLMHKCVRHHLFLLNFCKRLEDVYTLMIFQQYFSSTIAICVSCFVVTFMPEQMPPMLMFFLGHILQFFNYCSIGNELIRESTNVAEAAFDCGWYLDMDKDLRTALVLLMQNSQKEQQITALGFIEISYRSFLMVMRLSFSFYTFLQSFVAKQLSM